MTTMITQHFASDGVVMEMGSGVAPTWQNGRAREAKPAAKMLTL